MKHTLLLLLFYCSLIACKSTKSKSETSTEKVIPKETKIKASVINITGLDGCGFVLELENGEKLIPMNLEEKYFSDELKVWITYNVSNSHSICMVGKTIMIKSIEERKE